MSTVRQLCIIAQASCVCIRLPKIWSTTRYIQIDRWVDGQIGRKIDG